LALECSPIILVGQNFALRNGRHYADGVPYDAERGRETAVRSVHGDLVTSSPEFILMRREMEHYIRTFPAANVLNTTREGAAIEGATFVELSRVMERHLVPETIDPHWWKSPGANPLDSSHLESSKTIMLAHYDALVPLLLEIRGIMEEIRSNPRKEFFVLFDDAFRRLQKNHFFLTFLRPMNRVGYERLFSRASIAFTEQDNVKKAQLVLKEFGKFFHEVFEDLSSLKVSYFQLNEIIDRYLTSSKETLP
jgi:hypothetical protein